jgi:hypothetical protein
MLVKTKERKEIFFKEVKVGQVFRECRDEEVYMKIRFEDDCICCPRCDLDLSINDEKDITYAVELSSGLVYEFDEHSMVEIVQGAFIEE